MRFSFLYLLIRHDIPLFTSSTSGAEGDLNFICEQKTAVASFGAILSYLCLSKGRLSWHNSPFFFLKKRLPFFSLLVFLTRRDSEMDPPEV